MKSSGNRLEFSSGRSIVAFDSVVGLRLNVAGAKRRVCSGYDDPIYTVVDGPTDDWPTLTKEETIELAEFMVQAWREYMETLK